MFKINLANQLKVLKRLMHKPTREDWLVPILLKLLGLRIVTQSELSKDKSYTTISYGSEEEITTSKPHSLGEIPGAIAYIVGKFSIRQSFVSEVVNARLVGPTAVGFDQAGNVISETTLPPTSNLSPRIEGGIPIQSLFLKKSPVVKTLQLDTACSIVNYWSRNYYHWLVDSLARIEGFEYYQEQTGCKPLLLIHSNPTSWQTESLKLLGYGADDYIKWDVSKASVKKLVVPSFRRQGERVSPRAIHWLRQRLLGNLPELEINQCSFSRRVYISRAQASGRRVINEDEVMEILTPLGFASYTLEKLSFVEQVRLFSTAEMIIGPHGAGLTNIIFSPKNTAVIELANPWISPGFFLFSAILNLQHGCLQCNQPSFQSFRQSKGNMLVDTFKLKRLIEKMETASISGSRPDSLTES